MVFMNNDKDESPPANDWAGPNGKLGVYIAKESIKNLDAYSLQSLLVDEHANYEEDTAHGGYAHLAGSWKD